MEKDKFKKYCKEAAQLLINYDVPFDGWYEIYEEVEKERRIGLFKKETYFENETRNKGNYYLLVREGGETEENDFVERVYHRHLTLSADGQIIYYTFEFYLNKKTCDITYPYNPKMEVVDANQEHVMKLIERKIESVGLSSSMLRGQSSPDAKEVHKDNNVDKSIGNRTEQLPASKPIVQEHHANRGTKKETFYYGSGQPSQKNNRSKWSAEMRSQKPKRTAEKKPFAKSENKANVPDINRTPENKVRIEQSKANQNVQIDEISEEMIQLKHYAEQGDPKAQYQLAFHYKVGKGVKQDKREAFRWYTLASENGNTEATCMIASAYFHGEGCEKDLQKAFDLYEMAESKGSKSGTKGLGNLGLKLGDMYYNGDGGVEQDYQKALQWYQFGSDKGNAAAQCSIAIMYERGDGVEQNTDKAHIWYREAARNGDPHAKNKLRL